MDTCILKPSDYCSGTRGHVLSLNMIYKSKKVPRRASLLSKKIDVILTPQYV